MVGKCYLAQNDSDVIVYAHGSAVTAWTPIFVAGLGVLVPQVSNDASVSTSFYNKGVFKFTIASAVTVSKGDPLYYDSAAGKVQKTLPTTGFYLGVAVENGTATAGYVNVAINKEPMSQREGEMRRLTPATVSTAGAATQTVAQYVGGLILRDPNGASRTDTTPTAALIVAAISGAVADGAIRVIIENTADAEENITLSAGAGVTLDPTSIVISRGERRELLVRVTNATSSSEAVTIYDLSYRASNDRGMRQTTPTDGGDTAYTITAAAVKAGVVYGAVGQARTWTFDTAANILAVFPNARVGDTIEVVVINNATGNYTITVAVPASITNIGLAGHLAVTQNTRSRYLLRFTNIGSGTEAMQLIPA